MASQPTLLGLPRELRDRILAHVISAPKDAPRDHKVTSDRKQTWTSQLGWEYGKNVMYEKKLNRTDLIPVLLVSQQLNAEVMAAIQIHPHRADYVLDLILVDQKELWPTWLRIPEITLQVDHMYVAIRSDGVQETAASVFNCGDGSPPQISWCFYAMLKRFLLYGPMTKSTVQEEKLFSIQKLDLDVRTPDVPEKFLTPADDDPRDKTDQGFIRRPEYIVSFICNYFRILLGMSPHTAIFGGILLERIGAVRFLLDGMLFEEIDLASILARVEFQNSFREYPEETRPAVFKQWKRRAYDTRKMLRLPVSHEGLSVCEMEEFGLTEDEKRDDSY
jgi:hypothetical protein